MSQGLKALLETMSQLRDPETGCPWDLEQTYQSLTKYTIEEAYEVEDAAENGTLADLKEELGDLLLQVVFYAQIAKEQEDFTFDEIAQSVSDKLVSRHPHVFGNLSAANADDVAVIWEQQKAEEKKSAESVMDTVTKGLPSLMRAQKIQKKAAKLGFEWSDMNDVWAKLLEEQQELKDARTAEEQEEEAGDMLFMSALLCRHMNVDAEVALRRV